MPAGAVSERLDRDSVQCPGPLKAALRYREKGRELVPHPYRFVDDAEELLHQGFPLALQELEALAYDFVTPSEGQELLPRRRALFKYRHLYSPEQRPATFRGLPRADELPLELVGEGKMPPCEV